MPIQPAPGDSPPTDLPPADRPPPDGKSSGRKSPGGQPTPHDSVFRRFFGVPENAASELRAVLPPDLAARLDLGALDPVPGSFIDGELTSRHSDLLFKTNLDGSDAYVYLLIEHQSSNDPLMAFRMLRYMTRIWEQYLRQTPKARQLPAVIPLVVYYARKRWTAPTQMLDLINLDPAEKKAAERYLPRFEFLLDDLTRVSDSQLLDRQLPAPALMTLVIIKIAPGNRNVAAELRKWKPQLRAVLDGPDGYQEFIALIIYTERVSEAPASELHELAASLGQDAEEAYMTTADMLRAEGRAQGRAETLVDMLTVKFGSLSDSVTQLVNVASSEQLRAWTLRTLTAETLDQVFA